MNKKTEGNAKEEAKKKKQTEGELNDIEKETARPD